MVGGIQVPTRRHDFGPAGDASNRGRVVAAAAVPRRRCRETDSACRYFCCKSLARTRLAQAGGRVEPASRIAIVSCTHALSRGVGADVVGAMRCRCRIVNGHRDLAAAVRGDFKGIAAQLWTTSSLTHRRQVDGREVLVQACGGGPPAHGIVANSPRERPSRADRICRARSSESWRGRCVPRGLGASMEMQARRRASDEGAW